MPYLILSSRNLSLQFRGLCQSSLQLLTVRRHGFPVVYSQMECKLSVPKDRVFYKALILVDSHHGDVNQDHIPSILSVGPYNVV
jgi:hypothetical protein